MYGEEWEWAWENVVNPPLGGRLHKPRDHGLTMVLDKGLGYLETRDLLELGAAHIDIYKLTFGTSACYSMKVLREKIGLIRSYGVDVCPGGTMLEVAVFQGAMEKFIERARRLGFSLIEVSDGVAPMTFAQREACIRAARDAGLRVVTEVGKKLPSQAIPPLEMAAQAVADLENGAWKVIIEARESGKGVGIYDRDGAIKVTDMELIAAGVGRPEAIIWEAPLKEQQVALILRFGPNVNLGNIPPQDVIVLEAMRLGLRADTFKPGYTALESCASPRSMVAGDNGQSCP